MNLDYFIQLILEHLFMTISSVFLASLIAIPLSMFLYKKKLFVNLTLNIISILQSFPVLGMFAILVTFLGIGMPVAILTMFLYALMPIYVNTIQGFKSINPDYYLIVNSLNISKKNQFLKVELPIVIPFVISGIRIATTYTLSLVTIATLIGAGGLGELIYLGLQQLNLKMTLIGVIPILILTVLFNYFFNLLENALLPADQKNLNRSHNE